MLLADSNNTIESRREFTAKMDPRINIRWGDWMLAEDNRRKDQYLNLSDTEWEQMVKNHLRNFKGDIRSALNWVERIQHARIARAAAKAEERPREKPSELDITFRLWKDMIEEPWKYGDEDWPQWLEMDTELRNSKKRWRVAAFWQKKQDEADEAAYIQLLEDMATRIQAAWRGHQLRDTHPQLNCSMCLAHKPSKYLNCKTCVCHECMVEMEETLPECHWCFAPLYDGQAAFCDADCRSDFMTESWRD